MASVTVPANPMEGLSLVSTEDELDRYLHHHARVPFATHVASIEHLLNELIVASNAYKDKYDTDGNKEELVAQFILRKRLLTRYITFRSVGKMHRRFVSPACQTLLRALRSLLPVDVLAAVTRRSGPVSYKFTELEQDLIASILHLPEFSIHEFPNLNEGISKPPGTVSPIIISWEFHQLLLQILDLAQTKISTLYNASALENTPLDQFTQHLSSAENIMHCLNFLVHHSPLAHLHVQSFELLLCTQVTPKVTEGELDQDDDTLELISARQKQHVGWETLRLMVSFQRSVNVITGRQMLPKQKVQFAYYNAPQGLEEEAGRKTELHDWTGVVRSIFPAKTVAATSTTSAGDVKLGQDNHNGSDDAPVTADEVIAAMASYGATRKTRNTVILRTPPSNRGYSFPGCCHAEATIATMRFLSLAPSDGAQLPDTILAPFRNTYLLIGVSKRCCPLCALLISLLLSPHAPSTAGAFSRIILSYHPNIYPTALPRFLPESVAIKALTVMEVGVRRLGEVLARMARRSRKSRERKNSLGSVNSTYLKGQSSTRSESGEEDDPDEVYNRAALRRKI
ncbi:hypothetical protein EV426DRAFT_712242 [Tirmania nivea]|nr:hypothetical protein EV426DRAFT_712242 [Tirmania nivea]